MANEPNKMPSEKINPPNTAVKRVNLRRHSAITIGAVNIDIAQLHGPIHPIQ